MTGWQAVAVIGSVVGSMLVIVLGIVKLASGKTRKICEDRFTREEGRMEQLKYDVDKSKETAVKLELLRQEVGWIKGRMAEMEKQIGKVLDKMQLIYMEMPKKKDNYLDKF